MATYYISTTGNNSTGDGSSGNPWATLSFAISNVSAFGDIIHVNAGIYPAISTQMLLSNGVSIIGAGDNVVTIPLTYSSGTPCIKLETWGGWANKTTVGYQTISGIKFVGSTTSGTPIGRCAIGVNFRHHVEIHDCWFEDFDEIAVWFQGEPTYNNWTIDNPYETRTGNEDSHFLPFSDSFCEGNKFYNNEVHNSCKVLDQVTHDSSGELEVATQDGMLIYGNNMTALGRVGHDNGVPIKMIGDCGFNRNVKIYNNNINAGHKSTNYWQFAIEAWWNLGGIEIYNNVLNGSIDLCDSWDLYGVGFATKIYDNDIGYPTTTNEYDTGIIIEGTHIGDSIFRNKIHHVGKGIGINRNLYSTVTHHDGLYIYDNLFVELSGNAYQTWGIYMDYNGISDNSTIWRNWYIQHNTFVARADAPNPTYYGIVLPTVERFENLYIENNIFINWERGAIWGTGTRTTQTNFNIRNNLIYDCASAAQPSGYNDPVYVNSYPTAGITYSGTVKDDPLFKGGSPYSYELLSTASPAYHAGRDLNIATDYEGVSFHATTPSIGAYEFGGTPPEEPDPPVPGQRGRISFGGHYGNFNGKKVKW